MSGNKGYRRHSNRQKIDKNKPFVGDKGKEVLKDIDDNNPIIKAFQAYATEIDEKHDRYERIIKISRDITIESKRIIFLLHNADKEHKRDDILKEAEARLQKLIATSFKSISIELENQDSFQYLRAYTAGLQEFIEAFTFHQYLQNNAIQHWSPIEEQLVYKVNWVAKETDGTTEETDIIKQYKTPLPAIEYILGIADLTGELMRKCINSLGAGNIDDCFTTCNFVKTMYKGFVAIGNGQSCREIGRKAYVLKQSLHKMEIVCYNIVVRGSEVPKHMLANVISTSTDICHDDDEGYY